MSEQPTGTVTFLFTDIEGSTKLWENHPEAMQSALTRHDELLRQAIEAHGGYVFKTVGDAFCAAFATAQDALHAALDAQQILFAEDWGETPIRVRMALHTGATEERDSDYYGPPVNRVARLLSAGYGGQVLLSSVMQELVRDHLPDELKLQDLGEHRLKDLIRPEHIFQVIIPELPADFPPLKTLDVRPNNLPAQTTIFIGREAEVDAVIQQLARPEVRLLTLTGPGGTGKTRLSLQVAADVLEQFRDSVFFVPLAPISDPTLVIPTIVQMLGLQVPSNTTPLEVLTTYLKDKQLLLLLDNFEQLVEAATDVHVLLTAAPALNILVTSRTLLRLSWEYEYPVPPLHLPDPMHLPPLERLTQYEAVQLFIERARAMKSGFAVTNENAPAVVEICTRLDGLPLAIELAAARIRMLPPQKMLSRLEHRLQFLIGGVRDLPSRQQTLRSTIVWSYELLDEEEKKLFRRLAVFVGGCFLEAAETICNIDDELNIFTSLESLVDKNLVKEIETGKEPRFTMLETIREYALERLSESGETDMIHLPHARFFMALAEELQLVSDKEPSVYINKLKPELDNLRAALTWPTDNAIEVALRLAVSLEPFWGLSLSLAEGRDWLTKVLAKSNTPEPIETGFEQKLWEGQPGWHGTREIWGWRILCIKQVWRYGKRWMISRVLLMHGHV